MLEYILKIKSKSDFNANVMAIIIFKIFSLTLSYNKEAGDHLGISACMGPFEIGLNLSIWRRLLP